MEKQKLGLCLAPIALMCLPASPVHARSFDEPALTSISAFSSTPVNDRELASATGGFADTRGNLSILIRETLDQNALFQGEIGRLIMDNWFASEGADLLYEARLTPAP